MPTCRRATSRDRVRETPAARRHARPGRAETLPRFDQSVVSTKRARREPSRRPSAEMPGESSVVIDVQAPQRFTAHNISRSATVAPNPRRASALHRRQPSDGPPVRVPRSFLKELFREPRCSSAPPSPRTEAGIRSIHKRQLSGDVEQCLSRCGRSQCGLWAQAGLLCGLLLLCCGLLLVLLSSGRDPHRLRLPHHVRIVSLP